MPRDLDCPIHGRRRETAFGTDGTCLECRANGVVSQGTLALEKEA